MKPITRWSYGADDGTWLTIPGAGIEAPTLHETRAAAVDEWSEKGPDAKKLAERLSPGIASLAVWGYRRVTTVAGGGHGGKDGYLIHR